MTITKTRPTVADVEAAIGSSAVTWAQRCHQTSLAIVKSDLFEYSRVARGFCQGVGRQHSWVALGDPYDPATVILDPTLWSYDKTAPRLFWPNKAMRAKRYRPHGYGSIWQYGQPVSAGGPVIELTPAEPLSRQAQRFLDMLGPLDRPGWFAVSSAPVGGWPAGEIFAAMDDTEALSHMVPIDKLGMTTDRNPGELYLKEVQA